MGVRLFAAAALLAGVLGAAFASAAPLPRVPRYGVFEQPIRFTTSSGSPWDDVELGVKLSPPHGPPREIGGFYAGGRTWKFRFAPSQVGRYTWTARVADRAHAVTRRGAFLVVPGSSPGFVQRNPYNRFRWTFSDGESYDAIGIQDCTLPIYTDNPLTGFGFDGGQGRPRWTSIEPYLKTFAGAGFDLFRWGPNNCSFSLYDQIDPSGNVYSQQGGDYADQLVAALRRHGFRIEFVLFGFKPPFPTGTAPQLQAVERYVKYVVARYGAYVDFWELMNEATVSDGWYAAISSYLRRIDPYGHPIGTSYSRPDLPAVGFGSDHWYQREPDLDSDAVAWQRLRAEPARRYGKPTLVDEQGNSVQNWDPGSAVRMRLRAWTAFFAEATFVFWNTSATKHYMAEEAANIYLGPVERGYVRVLSRWMHGFDPRARVVTPSVHGRSDLRAYALRGPREYGLYLVDGASHSTQVSGATVVVSPAHAGLAVWTDPATGHTLGSRDVGAGRQTLTVPAFTTDVALKIAESLGSGRELSRRDGRRPAGHRLPTGDAHAACPSPPRHQRLRNERVDGCERR
jgi:hypothetical protein